jgi:hypothetical protein
MVGVFLYNAAAQRPAGKRTAVKRPVTEKLLGLLQLPDEVSRYGIQLAKPPLI